LTPKLQYSSQNSASKGACKANLEKIFILQNISICLNHDELREIDGREKPGVSLSRGVPENGKWME
jgi:hypothetical protein